ncbi:MAG TPA: PAS domain S-box protein [Candidatus Angelobacter sp.]|jgi:PAS domain S-box-containing protein|nr:PAS domain S-box protein [Candidatus Angelobacter sp.]
MSPKLEQIVIFTVMSILVTLFAWIYLRDRQQRIRLWMIGWVAIFIHFAAALLYAFSLLSENWFYFFNRSTLEVAGVSFLLSVSEVFVTPRKRAFFILAVGIPSVIYLTCDIWAPQNRWIFPALLLTSVLSSFIGACMHYRWKSLYLYSISVLLGPYAVWVVWRSSHQHPDDGLTGYLFALFSVTGILYWRHYKRLTPGVLTTSVSFIAWGLVFPVFDILYAFHALPNVSGVIWDLPKYFVAFGMILTLFESEAEIANNAAQQYQALFEGNLASVYLSTVDGELLDCNSAFIRMYGFETREELKSNPTQNLYVEPGDREAFLDRLFKQGQVLNYESRQRKKDGTVFWTLERATIATDSRGRKVIEGTSIDITERKQAEMALRQSEERFSTIFRHSPVGCGIVSLDGIFLNVNENLLRMLKLPADQVIGKSGVELGFWRSQEDRNNFYRKLRTEGSVQNLEIEFKDSEGGRHIGLYFATLVRIGDKECIFGMQLDCTEQRELEAKFLQAQKMEALGRLAGGVAHDFNNLLGVIGGYAELLEATLGRDENYKRYCAKIIETTQRASGLTRQLLTFSRKEVTRPAPLKPDFAIRELASMLSRMIGEDIEMHLDLRANGRVVIDKTHFEQIIFNIAVNSRDAMPGGGDLFIKTENVIHPAQDASGKTVEMGYVQIKIRDTGVGMDEETRAHAFEPFFTTKSVGRGTGLGLATVYGIVQQCGGEISIESELGYGTEITILLPAALNIDAAEDQPHSLKLAQGSGNILVVEDEAQLLDANAEFLRSIGYSVICASSGIEALELAAKAPRLDLVISDVVMPRMNGREFADRLLEMRPNTKVLFVSGYADDVVLLAGISTLGTPYLQKPFSLKQLGHKVQELLAVEVDNGSNGNR